MMLLTPELRQAAKEIAEYSAATEHWTSPLSSHSDSHHILEVHEFRCEFAYVQSTEGRVYKRLVIVPEKELYPGPLAACLIAQLFGFCMGQDEFTEATASLRLQELLTADIIRVEILDDSSLVLTQPVNDGHLN
jgi:hypothetical protein